MKHRVNEATNASMYPALEYIFNHIKTLLTGSLVVKQEEIPSRYIREDEYLIQELEYHLDQE